MTQNFIEASFLDAQETLAKVMADKKILASMSDAVADFVTTIRSGGRILSCGNGGSMCDSMHFAEELTGRFRKDRAPIAAMAMGDASHMSCVANDYGYDFVFSRYVEAWGRKGDALLAISTSGNSPNIIKAVESAKTTGMKTIGLLGKNGGKLKEMVDIPLIVPNNISDRIQEIHIKMIHIMIEGIERQLFPEHYA